MGIKFYNFMFSVSSSLMKIKSNRRMVDLLDVNIYNRFGTFVDFRHIYTNSNLTFLLLFSSSEFILLQFRNMVYNQVGYN